jgi:hypothetical protein
MFFLFTKKNPTFAFISSSEAISMPIKYLGTRNIASGCKKTKNKKKNLQTQNPKQMRPAAVSPFLLSSPPLYLLFLISLLQ